MTFSSKRGSRCPPRNNSTRDFQVLFINKHGDLQAARWGSASRRPKEHATERETSYKPGLEGGRSGPSATNNREAAGRCPGGVPGRQPPPQPSAARSQCRTPGLLPPTRRGPHSPGRCPFKDHARGARRPPLPSGKWRLPGELRPRLPASLLPDLPHT